MKKLNLITKWVSALLILLYGTNSALAQSNTVVIPMFGDEVERISTSDSGIDPSASSETTTTAVCPSGTTLIGGGGNENVGLVIADSFGSGSTWRVSWTEEPGSSGASSVTTHAICLK